MNQYKKLLNWGAVVVAALVLVGCGGAQDRAAAHLARGKHYLEQKDYPKAKIEFKNVLQINPKSAQGYYYLGEVAEAGQHWSAAYGAYSQAVGLNPDYMEARKRLAQLMLFARQTDKADEQVKKILAAKPDDPEGLTMKAVVLEQKNQTAAAEKIAEGC